MWVGFCVKGLVPRFHATDAMTSCGWRTAITVTMSNPARRAASNHTPDRTVILGSLMTTSGAAGNVVRNGVRSPALRGGDGHEHTSALDAACGAGAPCSTIRWAGGRPARYRRYICSKSVSRLPMTAAALNHELLPRAAAWS